MALKPLPTSTQTFRDLINGGYLYINKTQYLYELIRYPKGIYYFLARPRRFGESLLISTLDEIFNGNKEMFQGLWLHDSPYTPIIHIDFSRHAVKNAAELERVLEYFLEEIAEDHGIRLKGFDGQSRFDNIIRQMGRDRQVVILIDEYLMLRIRAEYSMPAA
ncbi:MAG: AAA family ATPase [Gammaproteobacteria bacterium]|nr:AAA family ATPase [Gammaproteobacteria bacterium]